MSKSHPSIPPNCDWFFKETMQKGTFGFELFDRDYDDWWPLLDIDRLEKSAAWRKIVASVARCAWLDEAELLYPNGGDFRQDYCKAKRYKEAMWNVVEWAQWGKADGK